jgi:hypothetical protein
MPDITDAELITKLVQATDDGRLTWGKSEVKDQFAARYAGKWTLKIDKNFSPDPDTDEPYPLYWLALYNAGGEEILKIQSSDEQQLDRLFELARRRALKVDEALSDLLKEIETDGGQKSDLTDEDIPF